MFCVDDQLVHSGLRHLVHDFHEVAMFCYYMFVLLGTCKFTSIICSNSTVQSSGVKVDQGFMCVSLVALHFAELMECL